MNQQQAILKQFEAAGAILRGHFILSSGLHSDTYVQCAKIQMNPVLCAEICGLLAEKIRQTANFPTFEVVVSPAMGGVVVGYEMARQLGLNAMFCERVEGKFTLRRGFVLPENARVLVVEDVVTTGKSSRETFACIEEAGGKVVAEASFIDRSNGASELGVPLVSLLSLNVAAYREDELPPYLLNTPAIKPGSRFIAA